LLLSGCFDRPSGLFDLAVWQSGSGVFHTPARCPQRHRFRLSSPPLRGSSRTNKAFAPPSSTALRPFGCGRPPLCLVDAIEAASGGFRPRRRTMAQIGTFKSDNGGFTGIIRALTLNAKATFRPSEKDNDKAPDYRIFSGAIECGAAWKKTSRDDREYLSVKLDDPSFPAPIYASLVKIEGDEGFNLIWSRRSGD
jgi:uncharacterized protein (DUF736 family)